MNSLRVIWTIIMTLACIAGIVVMSFLIFAAYAMA